MKKIVACATIAILMGLAWLSMPARASITTVLEVAAFFVPASLYVVLEVFMAERLRRSAISRRPVVDFEVIYEQHLRQLPYPKWLVQNVWDELSHDLGLDANRLLPSDRFEVELSVRAFPFEDLNEALSDRLNELLRTFPDECEGFDETRSPKTLADYVELTCRIKSRQLAEFPGE